MSLSTPTTTARRLSSRNPDRATSSVDADTALSSPDDAMKQVKTEAMDLDELSNGAHAHQEPGQSSVDASAFISLEEQTTTTASQETLEDAARSVNDGGRDGAQDQPLQTVASTGDQVPLLPQYDFPVPPAWSLRPPAKRRRTVKSIEGAEQEAKKAKKAKEAKVVGPSEWSPAEDAALRAGVDLIPFLGPQAVQLGSEKLRRPQLLAECVRRRTGAIRTAKQITDRMSVLRTPATMERLRGATMSAGKVQQTDWHARLGVNDFPHTKPPSLLEAYGITKGRKLPTSATAPGDLELDKKPCLNSPNEGSTSEPSPPQSEGIQPLQDAPASKQKSPSDAADSGEIAAAASPAAPVRQPLEPPTTAAPKSSPTSRKRSRTPDPTSFAADLSAILSTLVSGRDLTPSAHALFACGITSTSSLADLLIIDADVANVYLDFVGKRTDLSAFEVAWTKKALDAARRSVVRMV
ncbi:Transketolase [Rhodotorula toruloides]|uniref:TEA domain-containing protein n=2 Tax=Rhodotorula toruloides TaxID=5286 RepID=A0A2T0A7R9_RHOTO|nr:hypothetical protein AAT19DRAFT_15638 [Rhodotorula toruloides]